MSTRHDENHHGSIPPPGWLWVESIGRRAPCGAGLCREGRENDPEVVMPQSLVDAVAR